MILSAVSAFLERASPETLGSRIYRNEAPAYQARLPYAVVSVSKSRDEELPAIENVDVEWWAIYASRADAATMASRAPGELGFHLDDPDGDYSRISIGPSSVSLGEMDDVSHWFANGTFSARAMVSARAIE